MEVRKTSGIIEKLQIRGQIQGHIPGEKMKYYLGRLTLHRVHIHNKSTQKKELHANRPNATYCAIHDFAILLMLVMRFKLRSFLEQLPSPEKLLVGVFSS